MPTPVLVALLATGLSLAVSGMLLLVHRVWWAGVLLSLAGSLLLGGAVVEETVGSESGRLVLTVVLALLLPLALASYPRLDWRHPVDFVALATIAGAGALAVLRPFDPDWLGAMGIVSVLAVIAYTWWRLEVATGTRRIALVWMALAAGVPALVAAVAVFAAPDPVGPTVATAIFVILGPGLYCGVAMPDVIDVRGLVVECVVFGFAGIVYVASFALLVSLLDLVGWNDPSLGALGVVGLLPAVMFHPLRVVLRGVVDELLFGRRPDPLGAASQVAGNIGDDPLVALRAIREALVLPFAALYVDGAPAVSTGVEVRHTQRIPLALGDTAVGELVVGLRPGDLRLSASDQHVLGLVAPLLAQTIRVGTLAADLQVSREATITALEEERRRMRRDLHDGLGPRLAGIAFTSDAARNSLQSDPDRAEDLLASIRAETVAAIADIRRLVYGLRPPALDELGLVHALRQQAAALGTDGGRPLRVEFCTDGALDGMPAAVEVAAYRIVMEALTNVARHSGTALAEVSLALEAKRLVIEVRDKGSNAGGWSAGVGLSSMRERAQQLGGSFDAHGGVSGGLVRVVLPLDLAHRV